MEFCDYFQTPLVFLDVDICRIIPKGRLMQPKRQEVWLHIASGKLINFGLPKLKVSCLMAKY